MLLFTEAVNNAAPDGEAARQDSLSNLPVTVRRENTEGLEDKFGKFGLPQQETRHRYRTTSLLLFQRCISQYLMFFLLIIIIMRQERKASVCFSK